MVYYERHIFGKRAEHLARDYLIQHGCQIIAENYYCKQGEIDIIARDHKHVVFVEVRYRKPNSYVNALASITYKKQQKVIYAAHHFLQMKKWLYQVISRFDIILVQPINGKMQLDWLKNAFAADNK